MAGGNSTTIRRRSGLDEGPSDGELLARFLSRREGQAEAAFETLVRRHGPMVLRTCGQVIADRHVAEDAFQATFLILARKSASIRRPEVLGSWLHGVALRAAREAKMRDARRRRFEAQAATGSLPEPLGEADRPEATLIGLEEVEALHEEVARLPERYRVPVVLCELEGLSYEEVARRLQCPVSTIGVRLFRARQRLRARLIRRGIAPSAAAAEAVLSTGDAPAWSIPASLLDSTVRASALFEAGGAAALAGVPASAPALTLTHAVLVALTLAKFKVASATVAILAIASAAGLLAQKGGVAAARGGPAPPAVASRIVLGPAPGVDAPPAAVPVPEPIPSPDRPAIVEAVLTKADAPRPLPAVMMLKQLALEERARGEALFSKEWAARDPAGGRGDGLGPVFNETSCVGCHGLGAPGGAGPEGKNVVILTAAARGTRPIKALEKVHPGFGTSRSVVLHRYGTDPAYGAWRRQLIKASTNQPQRGRRAAVNDDRAALDALIQGIAAQASRDGRIRANPPRLNHGDQALDVSERNTPALFGAGLIDAISSEAIARQAGLEPGEVRGKVARDRDGRVGRFGWKAQVSRLHEFVRVACAGELGLEVPGRSQSPSPLAPEEKAGGLDMTEQECDALVSYVRALPAPLAVDPEGPQGSPAMLEGRRLFGEVGCATCHAPTLGDVKGIYSDLLLHDLGPALTGGGDGYGVNRPVSPGDEGPSPGEWRTPPLWGYRDSGPYLHDGRAETLEQAVALHAGQGLGSARRFFALKPEERGAIEAFLKSLVAPSAASSPGVLLAADLESRFEPAQVPQVEAVVRAGQLQAEAMEAERRREAALKKLVDDAMRFAPARLRMATNLERAGKLKAALEFYRLVAREFPDSEPGRSAARRIAELESAPKSP